MDDPRGSTALTTRPLRYDGDGVYAEDLAIAARLVAARDVAVLGEPDTGRGEVAAMLAFPMVDRAASFLAFDGPEPAGLCVVEDDRSGRQTFIDLFAPPGPRAQEVREVGLTRGVLAAHAHRDTAPDPGSGWDVRTGYWLADRDLAAAIAAHGFRPVRTFYRMRIASSSPLVPASAPALPEGVAVVGSDDEATWRRVWAIDEESFAEHYNHTPREFDEWWAIVSAGDTRDPEGWWLLTVDGEDAAICLLDESRAEIGDGYVAVLGVRSRFRGRGLAQLLLRRAFVHYRDRGRAGTQLSVDAENATGAVRLYERVGMSVTRAFQGNDLHLD